MSESNGSHAPDIEVVERHSVIEPPPKSGNAIPSSSDGFGGSLLLMVGNYANGITPWGAGHKRRDAQLREFIPLETFFASALGIVCSRNSGFSWNIHGPTRTVSYLQDMLENANEGKGWHDLITKTSIDLYTQDNGAFWELVRMKDSEDSPVIGINHLDAARCWHTGISSTPVVYQDWRGQFHLLKRWNVIEFADMPASKEQIGFYGLQYCSLTRLLTKAQTRKNIGVYDYEKTSGRNSKAIHLVKGITTQQLQDAINKTRATADSQGLISYMDPVLVGTISPEADVGHDTINMVDLPDGYDSMMDFNQYINLLAMAFMTDYQEFAPLPGEKLGTSSQSEMLHLKSRGKGPGTFMSMIRRALNYKCIPRNSEFVWDEQDLEAEKSDAEVRGLRAQTRAVRIASGEITPQVARQIANDEGDLDAEFIDLMGEQDVTPEIMASNDAPAQPTPNVKPGTPAPLNPPAVAPKTPTLNNPGRAVNPNIKPPLNAPANVGPRLR